MGRSTREGARANRDRVLDTAAGLLNERGPNGIGVADLMRAAGLTHGGFYRHFASKDDVVAAAAERAMLEVARRWREMGDASRAAGREPLLDLVADYLSDKHRSGRDRGCSVAALGPELARLPDGERARVALGVEAMVDALAAAMPGEGTADAKRGDALVALGTMVGAIILARLGVGAREDVLRLAAARLAGTGRGEA